MQLHCLVDRMTCNYFGSDLHFSIPRNKVMISGRSSLTNEKGHHYFLNRFVCVGEFFDG